jgi:heme A synthase
VLVFVCISLTFAKKNANVAMLLCVFPGGGQFYTERYVPGVIIGATEIVIGYYAYQYHRDNEYTKRNSLLWWGLFVLGYSLADAYVGAKMHGFDVEADIDRVSIGYKMRL